MNPAMIDARTLSTMPPSRQMKSYGASILASTSVLNSSATADRVPTHLIVFGSDFQNNADLADASDSHFLIPALFIFQRRCVFLEQPLTPDAIAEPPTWREFRCKLASGA